MTETAVRPGGTPKWTRDATANDSDKSFTVPAGKIWVLKAITIHISCTAAVGNRNLGVSITNGTNQVFVPAKGGNIAASQYGQLMLEPGLPFLTSTSMPSLLQVDTSLNVGNFGPIPELALPAGYVVRCLDISAVDAAADDMIVVMHYIEYDA